MSQIRCAIQPGLCPINPETGLPQCPPADRIECIIVEKVYDSCYQVDNRNQTIVTDATFSADLAVGDLVNCSLGAAGISCMESGARVPVGNGFYKVTLVITVPLVLTNPTDTTLTFDSSFVFAKQVVLCAPEGVDVNCNESTIIGCNCVVTSVSDADVATVSCDIQACIVIKSTLSVQLLVPSYGFCIPQQCVNPVGVCPPLPPAQCYGEPIQPISCSCRTTTVK